MDAIELARRLAGLGQSKEACQAYTLALESAAPEEKMEAAAYILQSGGDYRISYTCFQELYKEGHFREDCLSIMTQAFYEPNVKALKKRYEKNCRLLAKYPYIFRKDFVSFEELPIRFYPYDDQGYLPFYVKEERFGDYINFKNPVVSRNFFKDLEKPILADDVFSQYELEYLNDNVRDSERVGRENHVYLHYTSWAEFCAYLQCWNLRPLLESKKLVFLMEDELSLYPIDFKERFGIDYSQFTPQPVGIREVNKLIWHGQLSFHNGGDFFNEVFDNHPNLLVVPSVYLSDIEEKANALRRALRNAKSLEAFLSSVSGDPALLTEFYRLKNPTSKDLLVTMFLSSPAAVCGLDLNARVAPALFFQPHFVNTRCSVGVDDAGQAVLVSKNLEELRRSPFLSEFKYIKTFTPMRRITNSYAATIRFGCQMAAGDGAEELAVDDMITERIVNRGFLIDPEDRLYKDSVLVRFEDGKLNPKAAFTALAAFLDLPYSESMTVCTYGGEPVPYLGSDAYAPGFDPESIYRTYDEFANDTERYYIEYFMRDAYEHYGYDFLFYDGAPVDEQRAEELIAGFTTLNKLIRDSWPKMEQLTEDHIRELDENRLKVAKLLLRGLRFVNKNGQPLHMMPMLKLDPVLLEQPLYH